MLRAVRCLEVFPSRTRPAVVVCDDNERYVVKTAWYASHRALFTERCVAQLGHLFGAPVGVPELVAIDDARLVGANHLRASISLELHHAGPAHATRYIPNLVFHALGRDPEASAMTARCFEYEANHRRLARLAVLHTWVETRGIEIVYERTPPHNIHSVDHEASLCSFWDDAYDDASPLAVADSQIVGTSPPFVAEALAAVAAIPSTAIAAAIETAPGEWGVDSRARRRLVSHLELRRSRLLAHAAA